MPYLNIHTNVAICADKQAEFLKKASETAADALGKPESYVMVALQAGEPMLFAGSDAPLAYLQLKSLGMPADATDELSAALCHFMERELGIEQGRVYIEFAGPERHMWGWNGGTF
ncbi:MAG: phenylpyruvate tautomerase MIF-related protein [Mariprofundaceae bacterium]